MTTQASVALQALMSIEPLLCTAVGGHGNALEVVMGIWIERQLEFMGTYRINLATTALVQMLASHHPALMSLQVVTQLPTCDSDSATCAVSEQ